MEANTETIHKMYAHLNRLYRIGLYVSPYVHSRASRYRWVYRKGLGLGPP